jgi:hypothetical protein
MLLLTCTFGICVLAAIHGLRVGFGGWIGQRGRRLIYWRKIAVGDDTLGTRSARIIALCTRNVAQGLSREWRETHQQERDGNPSHKNLQSCCKF